MSTNIKQTLREGYHLFANSTFLLGPHLKKAKTQALKYPKVALTLVTIASIIFGFLRIITFPILCTSGVVGFLVMAIVHKIQNKDVGKCFVAWGISLLALALMISILVSIVVLAPVPAIFITIAATIFISVSITCIQINHAVYKN